MCLNRLASAVIVVPETIRNDHRVGDVFTDLPLSVEGARSVQQAAVAIRYHGVKYLAVVDDGCLVGVVAFRGAPAASRSRSRVTPTRRRQRGHRRGHSSDLVVRAGPMRIPARDLVVGDVLDINDWRLHVINIERDQAMAVLTAEFAFLIHFAHEDLVSVQPRAAAA